MYMENFININLNEIRSIIYENWYIGRCLNIKYNVRIVPSDVIDYKFVFVLKNENNYNCIN